MNLSELTLIVPYRFDTPQRKRNFDIVTSYFSNSGAAILPVEQSGSKILREPHNCFWIYSFRDDPEAPFHKTRLINQALPYVQTPVVGVLDTDVICNLNSLKFAVEEVLAGFAGLLYPYDGMFLEVPETHIEGFLQKWNQGSYLSASLNTMVMAMDSVGGLFVTNTDKFRELGGMNERFVSWGSEDKELFMRYSRIGMQVARISGPIYHLEHPRSINSGPHHKHFADNELEMTRLQKLDASEEWKSEIEGFPWRSRLARIA